MNTPLTHRLSSSILKRPLLSLSLSCCRGDPHKTWIYKPDKQKSTSTFDFKYARTIIFWGATNSNCKKYVSSRRRWSDEPGKLLRRKSRCRVSWRLTEGLPYTYMIIRDHICIAYKQCLHDLKYVCRMHTPNSNIIEHKQYTWNADIVYIWRHTYELLVLNYQIWFQIFS